MSRVVNLHGLTRVRSFTQDDAHIFCRPDQVKDEFLRVMDIISIVFRSMDFQNFEAQISLRDKVNREKYIGSDDNWEKAEQAIIEACAGKKACLLRLSMEKLLSMVLSSTLW